MKFSIRDLLLVTVTVALAVGWKIDSYRVAEEVRRLSAQASEAERRLDLPLATRLRHVTKQLRPFVV